MLHSVQSRKRSIDQVNDRIYNLKKKVKYYQGMIDKITPQYVKYTGEENAARALNRYNENINDIQAEIADCYNRIDVLKRKIMEYYNAIDFLPNVLRNNIKKALNNAYNKIGIDYYGGIAEDKMEKFEVEVVNQTVKVNNVLKKFKSAIIQNVEVTNDTLKYTVTNGTEAVNVVSVINTSDIFNMSISYNIG